MDPNTHIRQTVDESMARVPPPNTNNVVSTPGITVVGGMRQAEGQPERSRIDSTSSQSSPPPPPGPPPPGHPRGPIPPPPGLVPDFRKLEQDVHLVNVPIVCSNVSEMAQKKVLDPQAMHPFEKNHHNAEAKPAMGGEAT